MIIQRPPQGRLRDSSGQDLRKPDHDRIPAYFDALGGGICKMVEPKRNALKIITELVQSFQIAILLYIGLGSIMKCARLRMRCSFKPDHRQFKCVLPGSVVDKVDPHNRPE